MSSPSAPESEWQNEIATAEREANDAFLNRDLGRLDSLFSDELVVNSPINRVNDKRTLLHLLGTGVIGHVSTEIRHELIRRDGDLVIVMGSDAVKNSHAEPTLHRRFTNIWRREGDHWRLYVRHANVIADHTHAGPSDVGPTP
ncbi:MAG TPA: nuclear transport factor 2 family protein [Thermoanaerobaculia bacterium]|jgi:ketosteroid isomerase-like protein|nr:nuclear transport factor 2 family protein [Thermoanaerobaculia bacterium]